MSGKNVWGVHGGRSTGAKTLEGKERLRAANTTISTEGRAQLTQRQQKMQELDKLEAQMLRLGMLA